eukprot:9264128-Pyramimonas_sp.AAC.1
MPDTASVAAAVAALVAASVTVAASAAASVAASVTCSRCRSLRPQAANGTATARCVVFVHDISNRDVLVNIGMPRRTVA